MSSEKYLTNYKTQKDPNQTRQLQTSYQGRFKRKNSREKTFQSRSKSKSRQKSQEIQEKFLKNICKIRNTLITQENIPLRATASQHQHNKLSILSKKSSIINSEQTQSLGNSTSFSIVNRKQNKVQSFSVVGGYTFSEQEDQILKVRKQLASILEENKCLKAQKMKDSELIISLKNVVQQNKEQLNSSESNLKKLKDIIKESRIQQLREANKRLQEEIKKVSSKNNYYKLQIDKLKQQIQKKNEQLREGLFREQYFEEQLMKVRQLYNESKDQRFKMIESRVNLLEEETERKSQQLKSLFIKLDCIQKKHSDQIHKLNSMKNEQFFSLKKRYNKICSEFKRLKEIRHNSHIFDHDKIFTLELSPQS